MILSNEGIKQALKLGLIEIAPTPGKSQYAPSSVDLRLGHRFRKYKPELLDQPGVPPVIDVALLDYPRMTRTHTVVTTLSDNETIMLLPGEFLLGGTLERIHLRKESQIAARVEGRSTFARIGLSVHLTAPTVHLGFEGPLALEFRNHGKLHLQLTPGMHICQLIFERVGEPASIDLKSIHQRQPGP